MSTIDITKLPIIRIERYIVEDMSEKDELLNLIGKVAIDAKRSAEKQVLSKKRPKNWPVMAQGQTKDKKKRVLVVVEIEEEDD